MKEIQAVINADILNSTRFEPEITGNWLKELIHLLSTHPDLEWTLPPEIYRGDSFQGVLNNIDQVLKTAVLARVYLKSRKTGNIKTDIRVAIGIGRVDLLTNRPGTSDGEAFRLSGNLADQIKQQKARIGIALPYKTEPLAATLDILEPLIESWSAPQSEVILGILTNETVSMLSDKLQISQSAVSQRLSTSQWWAAEKLLNAFPELIQLYSAKS